MRDSGLGGSVTVFVVLSFFGNSRTKVHGQFESSWIIYESFINDVFTNNKYCHLNYCRGYLICDYYTIHNDLFSIYTRPSLPLRLQCR